MKCTIQSPSYLVRNVHSYCFRLIVPPDLQRFVGRVELRYSLETGSLGKAKRKSRFLAGRVQFMFQQRRKGSWMVKLSGDQIQQLVGKYIRESIDGWDKSFERNGDENLPYSDLETFQSYVSDLASIRAELIFKLNQGNYSMLEGSIETHLKGNGVVVSIRARRQLGHHALRLARGGPEVVSNQRIDQDREIGKSVTPFLFQKRS